MRQDEVRTTEHHHTPSIKARQPGRRKSNQIPRGRDQHRNWARTPQGTNHRGEGGNKRRGGADNSQEKDKRKEAPPHQERHTKAKEKTPAETQAETPAQQKHHKEEPDTRGNETRNQRQTDGKESTAQTKNTQTNNQTKKGGPGGELDPKKAVKRPPPHSSKREQITTRCPGTKGTRDQNGRNENHKTMGREEEGGRVATSYSV